MSKCKCMGVGVQIDNLGPNTSNIQLCECTKTEIANLRAELQRVREENERIKKDRDALLALYAERDDDFKAYNEREDRLREQLQQYQSRVSAFLDTMTAINQHQGYPFTQVLMTAKADFAQIAQLGGDGEGK